MVFRIQEYDRLLPTGRHAVSPAFAAVFALAVGGPDFLNLDVIDSLHRVLYLSFVGLLVHLERVRTLDIREMHSLLGDQRPNYNAIIIHINTRYSSLVLSFFMTDKRASLVNKILRWLHISPAFN